MILNTTSVFFIINRFVKIAYEKREIGYYQKKKREIGSLR
jgi:hypothetical protein